MDKPNISGVSFTITHTCADGEQHGLYDRGGWQTCVRCGAASWISLKWPDGKIDRLPPEAQERLRVSPELVEAAMNDVGNLGVEAYEPTVSEFAAALNRRLH